MGISGYCRGHSPIDQEENVPHSNATPNKEVLNPGEVAHDEGNLRIYRPDDARKHDGPHHRHVGRLAFGLEGLVVEDGDVEEEDYERGVEPVAHPTKDPIPVEEQVFRSLLI